MRLLVVEDDARLRGVLRAGLLAAGAAVDDCGGMAAAAARLRQGGYAAAVLDIALPDGDGLDLLAAVRAGGDQTPVLLLSARDTVEDRIRGLDAGADDYLVKPFAIGELLARLRSLVRRRHGERSPVIAIGVLRIDTRQRTASVDGQQLPLTPKEFAILLHLAQRRGEVVAQRELVDGLYAASDGPASNVIEHFIARLRRKLARAGAGEPLRTRRGEGYVLDGGG